MGRTKNVFISHVHEDDGEVGKLKDLLGKRGYTVRDSSIVRSKPNQAKSEGYIKSEILAPRIRWAGTVIVLVSPDTHTSKWVNWEAEYAAKSDTRIVGVWVRGAKDADLPKGLEQYADAIVGWDSSAIIDAMNGSDNWVAPDGGATPEWDLPRYSCQ